MDFGLRLQEGGSDFEPALEQAAWAEDHGLSTVYFAEHAGFPESPYWPNPFLGLAAVASRTEEVTLGTHIALLPLYNPVRLAGTIAQLDVISDGRVQPGLSVGWRRSEFDAMGVPFSERGRRATESLRVLDTLLTGGTGFDGEFFEFEEFRLTPEPVQQPRPPLLVGGWSSQAVRRAVEIGDGWLSHGGSLERNRRFADTLRERGGGRAIVGSEGVVVREDRDEAFGDAREFLKRRRLPHVREGNRNVIGEFESHLDEQNESLPRDTPKQVDRYTEELVRFELRDGFEEYVRDTTFFAGTPDMVVEQIRRVIDETGCDELILRPFVDGVSPDDVSTTMDLLGEEVLPSFR